MKWLHNNSVNVLEWPTQSPEIKSIEHLGRDLKMTVHRRFPSNLIELERYCKEEWVTIPKYREILNDERCPGFLLDAVRSAIKKQRTVIKSKMLGIPVSECSTDETDGPLFERSGNEDNDTDSTDSRPQESRIRNLFGFLTRPSLTRSSVSPSSSLPASSSTWEIIDPDEQGVEEEAETLSSS